MCLSSYQVTRWMTAELGLNPWGLWAFFSFHAAQIVFKNVIFPL
jgi:hypothetical protein